ncbi:helix-turn-helix transcriptional regulator [Ruegeria lacuscaerulensis]|uniref:helix-turn-helix transcriptional regulator n=1 Tax=Ruegeria lacuscaerulensis TaxID=55218 RepID=UPI00147B942A|nr:LuxR family transcriptional regulator [Ruegeria lacuscaerulensis]
MTSVLREIEKYLSSLGFNKYSVGTAFHGGEVDYLTTFPDEWQNRYFSKNYLDKDPLPPAALHAKTPVRWSQIASMFPKSQVMNEARDFGLNDGFAFAHKGIVSSVSVDTRLTGAEIRFVCDGVNKIINASDARKSNLSQKQRGILVLMASGLSNAEMAETCGVSENAIKGMKARIFKTLNVSTTAQAIGMLEHIVPYDA